ncbi:hypothetical protein HDU98_009469 [Podochytrium sp. JEL0797]|nr:hypothetical protein HDU98_009469 [Podochytrium sp. JEL0797]
MLEEASEYDISDSSDVIVVPKWLVDHWGGASTRVSVEVVQDVPLIASRICISNVSVGVYFPTTKGLAELASMGDVSEYTSWIEDLKSNVSDTQIVRVGTVFASKSDTTVVFRVAEIVSTHSRVKGSSLFVIDDSTAVQVVNGDRSQLRVDGRSGYDAQMQDLQGMIESCVFKSDLHARLNIIPPKSVLITGPAGVGKSHLIDSVLKHHLGIASFTVNLFDLAVYLNRLDKQGTPADRETSGVFNSEITLEVPSRSMRESISNSLLSRVALDPTDESIQKKTGDILDRYAFRISQATPGFVASDIKTLITRAKLTSTLRHSHSNQVDSMTSQLAGLNLSGADSHAVSWTRDFLKVLPFVKASQSVDTGFDMSKPDLRWDNIGGYEKIKSKLNSLILHPLTHPESYTRLNIPPPSGILLYGPSGCGKTLLARTLGATCPLNWISVNGSTVFSKYLGESEATVRRIFELARKVSPCIIFFDEIDVLEWTEDGASGVNERVLSTLLNEMDGVAEQKGVIVIGSTNRPEKLDDALLRPGRLDHHLHVSMPTMEDRKSILEILLKDSVVDASRVASVTEGFTPADLTVLVRESKYLLLRERDASTNQSTTLEWKHISAALSGALKGELGEVFKKAFEVESEDEGVEDAAQAAFWKSFGGTSEGTWAVTAFQQSIAEAAEMRGVLGCRPGFDKVNGVNGAWWRPGGISEEEAAKFVKFERGSKK